MFEVWIKSLFLLSQSATDYLSTELFENLKVSSFRAGGGIYMIIIFDSDWNLEYKGSVIILQHFVMLLIFTNTNIYYNIIPELFNHHHKENLSLLTVDMLPWRLLVGRHWPVTGVQGKEDTRLSPDMTLSQFCSQIAVKWLNIWTEKSKLWGGFLS